MPSDKFKAILESGLIEETLANFVAGGESNFDVDGDGSESLRRLQDGEEEKSPGLEGLNRDLKTIQASLSAVATMLLESDVRNPEMGRTKPSVDSNARLQLAYQMGVEPQDLESIIADVENEFGEGTWSELIIEGRTQLALHSTILRSAKWDKVESIALTKLMTLVEENKIRSAESLLAIASAANRAARTNERNGKNGNSVESTVNLVFNGAQESDMADGKNNGVTLRAGDLGTITLSLSARVKAQLEREKRETGSLLKTSKMLDAKELRSIAEARVIEATAKEVKKDKS